MGNVSYFSGIVKILENPVKRVIDNKTIMTTFRAEMPQIRQNKIVSIVFWGNLANEVKKYYQANDYILIEGYPSIKKSSSALKNKKPNKTTITVLKVYPFFLKPNQEITKRKND